MKLDIRWQIRSDMSDTLAIEADLADQWDEDKYLKVLRNRYRIGMVAADRHTGRVVGVMAYELREGRLKLLRLAVKSEYRGLGVGTALMNALKNKVLTHHRECLVVPVAESDLATQIWLRERGLKAVALRNDRIKFVWLAPDLVAVG